MAINTAPVRPEVAIENGQLTARLRPEQVDAGTADRYGDVLAAIVWQGQGMRCAIGKDGKHVRVEWQDCAAGVCLRVFVQSYQQALNEAEYLRLWLCPVTRTAADVSHTPVALFISDDYDASKPILQELRTSGLRLLRCATADKALSLSQEVTPHLIFVNCTRPGAPVDDMCRRLRHDRRTAGASIVLITTAAGRTPDRGVADAVFARPCSAHMLAAAARLLAA